MTLGSKLVLALKLRNRTQRSLVRALLDRNIEASTSSMQRLVHDRAKMSVEEMVAISEILGIPPSWFLEPGDSLPPSQDRYTEIKILMQAIEIYGLTVGQAVERLRGYPVTTVRPDEESRPTPSVRVVETEGTARVPKGGGKKPGGDGKRKKG